MYKRGYSVSFGGSYIRPAQFQKSSSYVWLKLKSVVVVVHQSRVDFVLPTGSENCGPYPWGNPDS